MAKDFNREFIKEDIQMANKCMKDADSSVIRGMQIKIIINTTTHLFKWLKLRKTGDTKYWLGC